MGLEDGVHELAVLLEVVDDEHPHARERRDHDVLGGGGHGAWPSSLRGRWRRTCAGNSRTLIGFSR